LTINQTEFRMEATRRSALCALAGVTSAGWTDAAPVGESPALPPKIARIWHGRTPLARAEEYRQYLFEAGVCKIAAIPGNLGVQMLMRKTAQEGEFMVVSYWDAIADVEGFAGAAYERVRDLPRDDEFLIDKETQVRHFALDAEFWRD
jgi:heme-degrading monooxygenase HmoA